MALTKVIGNGLGAVTQDGAATFNESSASVDFRVESNGNANMLFVDGSADKVGINTNAPNRMLSIENGDVQIHETGSSDPLLQFSVGNTQASPTQSYSLRIDNSDSDKFQLINGTSGAVALSLDTTGAITKPLQPSFMAQAGNQSNIATTGNDVTVTFSNEVFDRNADYNNSNYTFTAPLEGLYHLSVQGYLLNVDTAASYYQIAIRTSNRSYYWLLDPNGFDADVSYVPFTVTSLVDMDGSDTATVAFNQNGGSAQTDIDTSSRFSGYLVA